MVVVFHVNRQHVFPRRTGGPRRLLRLADFRGPTLGTCSACVNYGCFTDTVSVEEPAVMEISQKFGG